MGDAQLMPPLPRLFFVRLKKRLSHVFWHGGLPRSIMSRCPKAPQYGSAMHRLSVSEAQRNFLGLLDRVCSEGVGVELQRDDNVIAYLTPALPQSTLKARDLNAFLNKLPKLEADAQAFSADLRTIRREFPAEASPWG
jgi:antitoxin (DNA-binding transcriptional repressor) of toxin-antitoxin stability system